MRREDSRNSEPGGSIPWEHQEMWSLHRVRGQLEVYLARGLVGVGQKPGGHPDPQLWRAWNFLCPKHVLVLAFSAVS